MRSRRSGPARRATTARTAPVSQRAVAGRAAGAVGQVLDEAPAGELFGVGDLGGEGEGGLDGQACGEVDAFVAGELAAEGGQHGVDGFRGAFAGGVGAFVAHSFQHLVERHGGRAASGSRCGSIGEWLPFACKGCRLGRDGRLRRALAGLLIW